MHEKQRLAIKQSMPREAGCTLCAFRIQFAHMFEGPQIEDDV